MGREGGREGKREGKREGGGFGEAWVGVETEREGQTDRVVVWWYRERET